MHRIAVIGAGQFGQHHCRIVRQSGRAELTAVVDTDPARAEIGDFRQLEGKVDAAIVATPTSAHTEIGCWLLEHGIDVLVEKPMAPDVEAADRLIAAAERSGRILQAGHLERFNPAVMALEGRVTLPLFFEIHRLSLFSPRSLDVDVILDLMIHDIDIILGLTGAEPEEVRAAGVSILSAKVDIANARLQFPNGCVANLTASRVSTERVRKLRLFQPQQYVSLDYAKQELVIFSVGENRQVSFVPVAVAKSEPLQLQFDGFLDSVETRKSPKTSGRTARQTLGVALAILDKIKEHSEIVSQSLAGGWKL
ncbi:MAG TPA: Gfo/Idh/MocA family oxidoreductase [Bryobacteraceae bacterium]|nr:Gfo/Idh/MocA family oxidoreductase [Bryobacteraceae bacterium]